MTSLYDLPKDMLVKLISTIQEDSGKYYVVEVYYKHGESCIFECDDEKALRNYLIGYINREKYVLKEDERRLEHHYFMQSYAGEYEELLEKASKFQDLNNQDTKTLIELSQELGRYVLRNQKGYGIVAIIKGKLL